MAKTPSEAKWILASTTVRAVLVSLIPSVKVLLGVFGVRAQDHVMSAIVDILSVIAGVSSAIWLIHKRHKSGRLSFTPSDK